MENWNCIQRARQWVDRSTKRYTGCLSYHPPNRFTGPYAQWKNIVATGVARLMREARQVGYEEGYIAGRKSHGVNTKE